MATSRRCGPVSRRYGASSSLFPIAVNQGSYEGYAPPVSLLCSFDSGGGPVSLNENTPRRFSHSIGKPSAQARQKGASHPPSPSHRPHKAFGPRSEGRCDGDGGRDSANFLCGKIQMTNRPVSSAKASAFANRQPTGTSCRATQFARVTVSESPHKPAGKCTPLPD